MLANKTYLIINPFPSTASHGIHNYNLNLQKYLRKLDIKFDIFANDKRLAMPEFRKEVYSYVHKNYGVKEVIIEAPEVKASTLLLENYYDIHIRMHTPGLIAQKYDNAEMNYSLFAEECSAINQAKYVSSPSYGLLNELKTTIKRKDISVFKNPIPEKLQEAPFNDKEYDLIFMGRFQPLKGTEYINGILEKLPPNYKVILLGPNSTKFKISSNIKCSVTCLEGISGTERFEYVMKSKVLMQLSKFENCSMVIIEALTCGAVVAAWNVGGNAEIAYPNVLKIVPNDNVDYMAKQIIDVINHQYPSQEAFSESLEILQKDFEYGMQNLFYCIASGIVEPYLGINFSEEHKINPEFIKTEPVISHDKEFKKFGERIFGFSLSNEHIEEMWMPIINKFNADYKFVCRRPLGFMYKFNEPFYVDPEKYLRFDWVKYPNLLIETIAAYNPHKILFHNGLHPMYQNVLYRVKKVFPNIPFIYSELGWFPQHGHVYFDEKGTNGKSKIAEQSFEEFCEEEYPLINEEIKLMGKHILVITQLENDTNILVNSTRFKKMEELINYVIQEIGDKGKIIVKIHPLDENKERFNKFKSQNVEILSGGDLHEILSDSMAVIGINSTVLLEALKYDVNVYTFGDGLLNNKRVVIELLPTDSLRNKWQEQLYSSRAAKDRVIAEFMKRQIKLGDLQDYTVVDCLNMKAFKPLIRSVCTYSPGEESIYWCEKLVAKNSLQGMLRQVIAIYKKNELIALGGSTAIQPNKNNKREIKQRFLFSILNIWFKMFLSKDIYSSFKKNPITFIENSKSKFTLIMGKLILD